MFDKKEKKEKNNQDENYSKEADQTRFIYMMFSLAILTLLGLFSLEFFHPEGHVPVFFSSEIVHITINGLVIAFTGLAGYIFGKNAGTTEALLKMNGGNGKEKKDGKDSGDHQNTSLKNEREK